MPNATAADTGSAQPSDPSPSATAALLLEAQARSLDSPPPPIPSQAPNGVASTTPVENPSRRQAVVDPGVLALAVELRGWKRTPADPISSPTSRATSRVGSNATTSHDPPGNDDSLLSSAGVLLVIVGAAVAILKGPRGDLT